MKTSISPLPALVVALALLPGCTGEGSRPLDPAAREATPEKAGVLSTFIVHGDTHSGSNEDNPDVPWVHPALVAEFTFRNPGRIFHVGDVVDRFSDKPDPYLSDYDPVWGDLIGGAPFYPTLGNQDREPEYFAYFDVLEGQRRYVRTDSSAGCLFVVLDVPHCDDHSLLQEQEDFLFDVLAAAIYDHLPHRFVFFHEPPYTTGQRRGCPEARTWDLRLRQHGVDVVFTGHTHAFEHFVSPTAGDTSPLPPVHYVVAGKAGGYDQSPLSDIYENLIHASYVHHYVQVYIGAAGTIDVHARRPDGTKLHSFQIQD